MILAVVRVLLFTCLRHGVALNLERILKAPQVAEGKQQWQPLEGDAV